MNPGKVIFFGLALVLTATGCGPSASERAARQRQRLELEEKARREADAANKAVTEANKKLGRKPPPMDLGVPPEPKPEQPRKP